MSKTVFRTPELMNSFRDNSVKIFIVSHGEVDTRSSPFPVKKNDLVLHTGHLYKCVYDTRTSETLSLFESKYIKTTFQYLKGERNQKTSPSTVIQYLSVYSESEPCPQRIHSYTQEDKDTRPHTGWGIHMLTDADDAISIESLIPIDHLLMRQGGIHTSELIEHVRKYISREKRVIFTFISCAVVEDRTAISHALHSAATGKSHYTVKPSLTGESPFGVSYPVARPIYPRFSENLSSGAFHPSALGENYVEKEEENSENENVPNRPYRASSKQYEVRVRKSSGANSPVHSLRDDYNMKNIDSVVEFLKGREFQDARKGEEARGSKYYVLLVNRKGNAAGKLSVTQKEYPIDTFIRMYQTNQEGEKGFCERCTNAVCSLLCLKRKKEGGRRKTRKHHLKLKARKTKHKKQ